MNSPLTTVVLAMSADGKIADAKASPARFGSAIDKAHLQKQIASADGVLFGAGTLRAYGTTLSVSGELLKEREQQGKTRQPVQIVCSASGELDPQWRFFRQEVPRWLLTTSDGAKFWQQRPEFERVLVAQMLEFGFDWVETFKQLAEFGLERLAVLGGGKLVASLLAADLIDELWLTVCPLILGGVTAPTPVEGAGFLQNMAPRLELLAVETVDGEVFLHYRVQHSEDYCDILPRSQTPTIS